jgi:hypothetical protein
MGKGLLVFVSNKNNINSALKTLNQMPLVVNEGEDWRVFFLFRTGLKPHAKQ